MYPFVIEGSSEKGWKKIHPFPALLRLQASYESRREVDRGYWCEVFQSVATRLHASNPMHSGVYWPLGLTFRGYVCILYPTFDGGRMVGTELDRPLEVHITERATPEMAYGTVLAMLGAHQLVGGG